MSASVTIVKADKTEIIQFYIKYEICIVLFYSVVSIRQSITV